MEQDYDEQSLLDLNRAIELHPDDASSYYRRGYFSFMSQRYKLAVADFDRALQLGPNDGNAHLYRGLAYLRLKKYKQSLADFHRLIELHPTSRLAYTRRAFVYQHLSQDDLALSDLDRVIELALDVPNSYTQRGYFLLEHQQHEKALADFHHAVEIAPGSAHAYYNRAYGYLHLGDRERARRDLMQCLHGGDVRVTEDWLLIFHWTLAFTNMGKERPGREEADALERIARIAPQTGEAALCRAVAWKLRDNPEKGLGALKRALSDKNMLPQLRTQDVPFWRGMLLASLGRSEQARKEIEYALKLGMPPILLAPLYWLEQDQPAFFERYARPWFEKEEREVNFSE